MYRGRLVGHNGAVSALTMSGNLMASGARDRLIKVYCVCLFDHLVLIHAPPSLSV